MASIGPQLPPSLTKRKRDPDNDGEDDARDSPPTKVHATGQSRIGSRNENEIALGDENSGADDDDDDDDGFGPCAARPAAPKPKSNPSIGPTLPSSVATAANTDEIALDSDDDDDDDDDDVGPAPAPSRPASSASHNRTTTAIGPPAPAPAPAPTKRVHGPAPPPAPLSEKPTANPDSDSSDSSDDDDYGPALPTSTSHQQRHRQAERLGVFSAQNNTTESTRPKRDDWMLAPPSAGSGPRAPDPTKLKSRGFATGPRAGNGGGGGKADGEISSIWTETPEEKRRRLENAVLGRGDGSGNNGSSSNGASTSRRTTTMTTTTMMAGNSNGKQSEEGQQDRIREYTESTRGRSLYEEHQLGKKTKTAAKDKDPKKGKKGGGGEEEEEEDDPSKRAFDKEKDMKLGGRIGTAQRRELLTRAADFGGRFAKGKYL